MCLRSPLESRKRNTDDFLTSDKAKHDKFYSDIPVNKPIGIS